VQLVIILKFILMPQNNDVLKIIYLDVQDTDKNLYKEAHQRHSVAVGTQELTVIEVKINYLLFSNFLF
jgi:hypothetical protein